MSGLFFFFNKEELLRHTLLDQPQFLKTNRVSAEETPERCRWETVRRKKKTMSTQAGEGGTSGRRGNLAEGKERV